MTIFMNGAAVDDEVVLPFVPEEDRHLLPEQEWCEHCDEPRDIVDINEENGICGCAGVTQEFTVYDLACGHSITVEVAGRFTSPEERAGA